MENEGEQVEEMKAQRALQVEMSKNSWGHPVTLGPQGPSTSSKCEGPGDPVTTGWGEASRVIGSFIGMSMVGFCFGIGAILAIKMVNSLQELISRK